MTTDKPETNADATHVQSPLHAEGAHLLSTGTAQARQVSDAPPGTLPYFQDLAQQRGTEIMVTDKNVNGVPSGGGSGADGTPWSYVWENNGGNWQRLLDVNNNQMWVYGDVNEIFEPNGSTRPA